MRMESSKASGSLISIQEEELDTLYIFLKSANL